MGENCRLFAVSKEDVWWHLNPNKGGDIHVGRSYLVGVGSGMGIVDQTKRTIFMDKKEDML